MSRVYREVFSGSTGKVYVNGILWAYVQSINVKVTGDFEDLDCCGDFEKGYIYNGYSVEGDMTVLMTSNEIDTDIMESYRKGIMPEYVITTVLTNQNTNQTASYSIPDVVFTETSPVDFKREGVKKSLPFKCGMPKKIA